MLWVKKSQNKKHLENMLFSCFCKRKLSCFCYEGRGKAKTKGEKLKSEKKLSSAGRQLAVEGTHRKWQDKHENIQEDHKTHSREQKKLKKQTREHTQKTARGDRNTFWVARGLQISLELIPSSEF